ncbi:uncharacterized protein si:ch211-284k5.2 isoform X1 [Leucoraja erinacea]|uniref:uncharacterized protein si:ch211-284k5.2 isoform X1 n=1 Tax=Leucoraja erinaceus TaxID=7782 RepID=UPI002456EDDF|nr:uncharacterized protein si:ch211-284k5.2 isoform X1 [Leucoraja erinacea]
MHRHYQPTAPASNRYLQQKWDQDKYQKHRTKVETAAAVVDTKGSWTPAHIQVKLKKVQLQEDRLAIIARDNQILSFKLVDIMRSNGTVENWNNYICKSLNAEKRHRQSMQITQENQAIFHRITQCKSQYKSSRLNEEWERVKRVQNDIAHFPRGTKAEQKTRKKVHFGGIGVAKNGETTRCGEDGGIQKMLTTG